ncbi:polyamine aminopropyltransferase [Sanyastnella coralliicola]|uniref:polyamine aminopropyltransferase n=1 Tax=Sanyastnella coralliicola TaxID=3069118 RepID=UPI0027B961F2|nr:polyamine aminopropyltransferase [Longitalea sp. SCSIO 12813]
MGNKILFSASVFIAGLCSIVYELLISTAATYFLGDGVKQFSIVIGVYLFSMGIGAYVSKFHSGRSLMYFVRIEYLLGLIGGISVPLVYWLFVTVSPQSLQLFCLGIVFLIGFLTGMEVPLLTYSDDDSLKDSLSKILSLDYIGGLLATLVFPFILLPFVGLFYSSLMFGALNIILGLVLNYVHFREQRGSMVLGVAALLVLGGLTFKASHLLQVWDQKIYKHPIVYNEQTPYQKIVLTQKEDDLRLYLNRIIQFSSKDEHRYHEPLVHVPIALKGDVERVLILGGGENLASREALKHANVKEVHVVDIDTMIFHLAKTNPFLVNINEGAASDPRVKLIQGDAFTYLVQNTESYDVIIADLPDPSDQSLAKLYSRQFYFLANNLLKEDGVFVTQAGEIYFANSVFSCIYRTMEEAFENVTAYHSNVPSFGDWGFIMASKKNNLHQLKSFTAAEGVEYLDTELVQYLFMLPPDVPIKDVQTNSLDHPIILDYYLHDWNKWKAEFQTQPGQTH